MSLPRGADLPLQHNSCCNSIKQQQRHLLGAWVCMWLEVRMCVYIYVCVQKAEVWCTEVSLPEAACCSVLTAAGEQCYGPWQLVKGITLKPLPPCCVLGQHISEHTHPVCVHSRSTGVTSSKWGRRENHVDWNFIATGTNSADWLCASAFKCSTKSHLYEDRIKHSTTSASSD